MDDETKNLIKEQYAKLPPALQQAIQSADLHNQIVAIATKNQLHIDQMGLLEDEVSLLMMGFTEPIEFAGVLQEHVHVDATLAQKIAADVNQEILLPIRDKLENGTTETKVVKETKPAAVANPPIAPEKSVVMPSSVVAPKPAAPASAPVTLAPTDMQINAPVAAPQISTPPHEADVMFSEPTISMPKKVEAPAPAAAPVVSNVSAKVEPPKANSGTSVPSPAPIYKADPYREPIE